MATIGPNLSLSSVGPAGSPDISFSNLYAVFQSPWGIDNKWQICSSFADFLRLYGGLSKLTAVASGLTADTYTTESTDAVVQAYYAIKGYFDEKGSNSPGVLFANRVIATSSGPTAASKTFADQAGANSTTVASRWKGRDGGTIQAYWINPSPRLGVFTALAGTLAVTSGAAVVTGTSTAFTTGSTWVGWGIRIGTNYYTILSVASATSLTLAENANATETAATGAVGTNTTGAYLNVYHPQSGLREEWDVLPTTASAADISKRSQLVTVTLPAGLQLPKTTAPGSAGAVKLNSGTSATADPYTASDSDYVGTTSTAGVKTGLQVFNDQKLATGFVAIPGKVSSTIRSGIKTHVETYYRYGLLGPAAALNLTTASVEYANTASNLEAGWVPRVWVPDQTSTTGGNVLIDNVGHIAGLGARMDRDYGGPHKSPAGVTHGFNSVVDVERDSSGNELFDDSGSNTLADFYVNTLRIKGGPISWGLRSFASDERYRQINVGRTVCLVYLSCFQLAEKATFEPIDSFGKLFSRIKGDLDAFFSDLWAKGSIYGNKPSDDPKKGDAWFVVCNNTNNPNPQIGKGVVQADVSFVPTLNAEQVRIPIMVAAPGFGAASAGIF